MLVYQNTAPGLRVLTDQRNNIMSLIPGTCWVLSFLLLLLCCGLQGAEETPTYLHTVYVDNESPDASNTAQCGNTVSFPCTDLAYVLRKRMFDSTKVVVKSGGRYTMNESITIENISRLAVMTSGDGSLDREKVTVTCIQGAGLGLVNCVDVQFHGILLVRCSALQLSTSRNFSSFEFSFIKFPVALYFLSCKNINLTSITISDSSGTGLAVIATGGQNYFQDCTLTNNGSPNNNAYPSGGGMYIELSFSSSHYQAQCNSEGITDQSLCVTKTNYEITQCIFGGNLAYQMHPIRSQSTHHPPLGSGGGLSVYINCAHECVVTVTDCLFQNNKANYGGGAAIKFQWNNSAVIKPSMFSSRKTPQEKHTGMGGLKLSYSYHSQGTDSPVAVSKVVTFMNCTFRGNRGVFGGGFLLKASIHKRAKSRSTLKLLNCSWIENRGRLGSAVNIEIEDRESLVILFTDSIFKRNSNFPNSTTSLGPPITVETCSALHISPIFNGSVFINSHMVSDPKTTNTLSDIVEKYCTDNIESRESRAVTLHSRRSVEALSSCAPGFNNKSGHGCECDNQFGNVLLCNGTTAKLQRGLWIGKPKGSHKVVVSSYPYFPRASMNTYIELGKDWDTVDKQLCGHAKRTGSFCGKCIADHAPSINSLVPSCVECTMKKSEYYWTVYIGSEVVPVTLFFLVIMWFHISVTRGAINSFVLFAQLVTTTFDINGDKNIPLKNNFMKLQESYKVLYNFWNLNLFFPVSRRYCLSPKLDTITVLSLHYLLAFYSLALIFVFYCLVRLYEHGIQPFYFLGKPIHYLLRFFRRRWNLSRSTVDAFSTFLVLSSTKFTLVSVYLLTPVVYTCSEGTKRGKYLYFQGNVEYLNNHHIPYFIMAVFVTTTFVLLPTLLLLVYPLRLVEWLAARLGYCGHLLRPGHRMNLFLDSFQGCFKDGTNGTRDYRYFAGIYFLIRTMLFASYAFSDTWFQHYVFQQQVCTVSILLFAIIRPYKNNFYNGLDATMLGILATINGLSMYNMHNASQGYDPQYWAFILQFILIYCPLFYLIGYLIWKILKHRKRLIMHCIEKCFGNRCLERRGLLSHMLNGSNTPSMDEEYRQFADEVEAFGRDREMNHYRPLIRSDSSASDSEEVTSIPSY